MLFGRPQDLRPPPLQPCFLASTLAYSLRGDDLCGRSGLLMVIILVVLGRGQDGDRR